MSRLALSFPWLLLVLVGGWIVIDQTRGRETERVEVAAAPGASALLDPVCGMSVTTDSAFRADVDGKEYHFCAAVCRDRFVGAAVQEEQGAVGVDPVCGMGVRRQASYRVAVSGKKYYFCTSYCRDEFTKNPGAFTAAPPPTGGHTMHGIPGWMYQAGVAVLLLVSFVLLEVGARRKPTPGPRAVDARWNVTASAAVRRLLRWRPLRFLAQALTAGSFLLIIAAGLFGDQNPATNIAPLLTWTIWWAGLIFLVLFFGKAWCYVCPWDALATWLERLKFWGQVASASHGQT